MRAYTADMIPGGASPVINVSQYDNDYAVTVTLIEGAEIYTPPSGATIMVEGTKPDSNGFSYACTYQGNVVTVPIYTQMTAVAGRFPVELVVYQSGLRVGSCNITLAVERAPLDNDEIISDSDIPAIIALAQAQADAAASSAASAETAKDAAMDAAQDAIDAAQELQTAIQFNAALIHDTASGAVASFADGADNIPMQSVVAEITPVQSGSGDPSPTNVRPISGRTGLTVTKAGKNILNPSAMVRGSVFVDNGDGTYTFSKTGTGASGRITLSSPIKADDGTTVTFSANITGTHESEIYVGFALNETTGGASAECTISNGRITGTVTSTGYMNGIRLYWRNNSAGVGTDSVVLSNMQVEYGSAVTDYEAPSITTIPISWETEAGAIYGGTLDVVSGVLTVDSYFIEPTASDIAAFSTPVGVMYFNTPNRPTDTAFTAEPIGLYCNRLPSLARNVMRGSDINGISYDTGINRLQFRIQGITTQEDARTWVTNNPLQVVYKLATPQTYQLTPTEVRTLLGGNTIYTDAGSVTVEYIADTKLYIDNKIAELQALVLEN